MPRSIWTGPDASIVRLCRARDLIRDFLDGPVTLEECAEEAGLSPWHALRAFRAAFGETPKEFHTRLRLDRAKHLLTTTTRSVTEVCFDVGCSSLGTFSTRFTELVGMPPSTYKREQAEATAGMPSCVAKQVTRPVRNREASSDEPQLV
jgi:transcriptional regulator GlxA family with amidase domain